MQTICSPSRHEWPQLIERNAPRDADVTATVAAIISEVERDGDAALRRFAFRFDGARLEALEVTPDEVAAARAAVTPEVKAAIARAARNIETFHAAQKPAASLCVEVEPGVRCEQRAVPIQRVGLYVPGGRAPLFSTVLMLALPARLAGCPEVVLCTPPDEDGRIAPEILFAAHLCGVHRIYKTGGAQAIAAMALGTSTVPRVDKIFGPGNRYVTRAKQLLSSRVAIDMPAGPSEVLVMADAAARPDFAAADMLSQAEHGPDSQALLVCNSVRFAVRAEAEVMRQAAKLKRGRSVAGSLAKSRIIVLPTLDDMVDFANLYAPEHLIIHTEHPDEAARRITAAGSVFLGAYSPESAGDYASGTNHTLPTAAWARSFSGVNIDAFVKKITFQTLTPDGLARLAPTIIAMAEAEGLDAHANAVRVRMTAAE